MVEPPYGVIWECLRSGAVVPFLGAGASFVGRPASAVWDPKAPSFLPSSPELSTFLARETRFPSDNPVDTGDLAKVSSYYADISGRKWLRQRLHRVLSGNFRFGAIHELLASLPLPLVAVTTNYDNLLERAFLAASKPYDLVVYAADQKEYANAVMWWPHGATEPRFEDPNRVFIDLGTTHVIYKIHGSIAAIADRWDSFVITEEDYVEFLTRMTTRTAIPAIFMEHFAGRSFLFLGYSLKDWNLRVLLRKLQRSEGESNWGVQGPDAPRSWAIQRAPSQWECQLWAKRGVNIFDMEVEEFAAQLQRCAND